MKAKDFLKIILKDSPYSQKDISNYMGIDQSLVSMWKNGKRIPNSDEFKTILNIHGYSLADFINGNTTKKISVNFRCSKLTPEDMNVILMMNTLFANIDYMEGFLSHEIRCSKN